MNTHDDNQKLEALARVLRHLPAETPSADFDARFWKRFDAPPPAKPWPAVAAATAIVGACLGVSFWLASVKDRPAASLVHGKVSIAKSGRAAGKLSPGFALSPGDAVRTASGWTVFELENGYRLRVEPDSEIEVRELKPSKLPGKSVFFLKHGQVLVSIGEQEGLVKYPVEIMTSQAFARALGTQFAVTQTAGGPSNVSVLRGVVAVGSDAGGDPALVRAGHASIVSDGEIRTREIPETAKKELEELFQFGRRDRAILLLGADPGRARELLRPCMIFVKLGTRNETSVRLAAALRDVGNAASETSPLASESALEEFEAAAREQTLVDDAPLLLFAGAVHFRLGAHDEAARLFEDVALRKPDSSFASLAWMAASYAHEELGKPDRASAIRQDILKKHPNSPEATAIRTH